jgi:hypothetical protein
MLWKLALALVEIALLLARRVQDSESEHAAAAKIFVRQQEKARAAIDKAIAARAGANAGGVRDPDPNSRD